MNFSKSLILKFYPILLFFLVCKFLYLYVLNIREYYIQVFKKKQKKGKNNVKNNL